MAGSEPVVRVGDSERRSVDDRLQAAVGDGVLTLNEYDQRAGLLWQARTRGELDELVSDLPAPHQIGAGRLGRGPSGIQVATSTGRSVVKRAGGAVGSLLPPAAVLGGVLLAGPTGTAVFGSSTVPAIPGQDVKVSVLFGSTEVIVPDGARVETSGFTVFGSTECNEACAPASGNRSGDIISVRGIGAFGSITVKTQSEARQGSG